MENKKITDISDYLSMVKNELQEIHARLTNTTDPDSIKNNMSEEDINRILGIYDELSNTLQDIEVNDNNKIE